MPEKLPSNVPMPLEPTQLVRAAVRGVTDKIPELKAIIAAWALDEHLKQFMASELDELSTNAAEIHLHDVEMPDGGFNLHLTIKPIQLGESDKAVFVRAVASGDSQAPIPDSQPAAS
ncbi:MAG: hypothetical protein ABFD89_06605 [Bryobacteraceae bacterium]